MCHLCWPLWMVWKQYEECYQFPEFTSGEGWQINNKNFAALEQTVWARRAQTPLGPKGLNLKDGRVAP